MTDIIDQVYSYVSSTKNIKQRVGVVAYSKSSDMSEKKPMQRMTNQPETLGGVRRQTQCEVNTMASIEIKDV